MNRRHVFAACAAVLALGAAGAANAAAAGGTTVTVRIEGKTRTLLGPKVVHVPSGGWITKGGVRSGKCPASSAQGALDAATHGSWSGKWYGSLGSYEIFTILGDHENGQHYFWEIFVDNGVAAIGACELHPTAGAQLLFAVVPLKGAGLATALRGPTTATVGTRFRIQVVYFTAAGKSKPLAHARVTGGGVNVVTNRHGYATIKATRAGTLVLRTSPPGYVRAVPLRVQELPFY